MPRHVAVVQAVSRNFTMASVGNKMAEKVDAERLYHAVSRFQPDHAYKVTAGLLESDRDDLFMWLQSDAKLCSKIHQTMAEQVEAELMVEQASRVLHIGDKFNVVERDEASWIAVQRKQKLMLGELLYHTVCRFQPDHAYKITEKLLESDDDDDDGLFSLLLSDDSAWVRRRIESIADEFVDVDEYVGVERDDGHKPESSFPCEHRQVSRSVPGHCKTGKGRGSSRASCQSESVHGLVPCGQLHQGCVDVGVADESVNVVRVFVLPDDDDDARDDFDFVESAFAAFAKQQFSKRVERSERRPSRRSFAKKIATCILGEGLEAKEVHCAVRNSFAPLCEDYGSPENESEPESEFMLDYVPSCAPRCEQCTAVGARGHAHRSDS